MRKPKISEKYDEKSFIKGYKKGWGSCLGKVIGFIENYPTKDVGWTLDELMKYVLSKHPYHSSIRKANGK